MSWQHLKPSSTPVCRVPVRCSLLLHSWLDMGTLPGMGKRMKTGRRGCTGCGRVEVHGATCWGGGGWDLWGYVTLANVRYGYDPVAEDKQSREAAGVVVAWRSLTLEELSAAADSGKVLPPDCLAFMQMLLRNAEAHARSGA